MGYKQIIRHISKYSFSFFFLTLLFVSFSSTYTYFPLISGTILTLIIELNRIGSIAPFNNQINKIRKKIRFKIVYFLNSQICINAIKLN